MRFALAPAAWIAGGFSGGFILAAAVLLRRSPDVHGINLALRSTARWSFLLFWIAYSGRDLAAWLPPTLASIAGLSREFGLAFAAAHLIHIGLVVWLWQILHHSPLSTPLSVFFGIGMFWAYLLAILSIGALSSLLGPRLWQTTRFLGSNYLLLAFAKDFVPPATHLEALFHNIFGFLAYAPFAAMCVAALVLRFSTATLRQDRIRRAGA